MPRRETLAVYSSHFREFIFPPLAKSCLTKIGSLFVLSLLFNLLYTFNILGTSSAKACAYQIHIMKTTTAIFTASLSLAAPSFAAWLFAGQTFSADILLGSYSIAGLLFIAATDYSPRRFLKLPRSETKATASWTRLSLTGRPNRSSRSRCAEEIGV